MNRYTEIKYSTNRGFSNGLLTVLVLFTLATAGFVWVSMGIVARDRWPIRWLEISGNFQRVSAQQLRSGLTPLIDSSFFTIDLKDLRDAADRISWVANVHVQKRWPDTVVVSVEEFVPFAHWNRGKLISSKGEAFAVPEADTIQGLPWLRGPENQRVLVLENWTLFNDELAREGLEILHLDLNQRGAWSMVLTNGTRVHLGRDETFERLQRLMTSWAELLKEQVAPPHDVDLRYSNGFAVNWPKESVKQVGNDS